MFDSKLRKPKHFRFLSMGFIIFILVSVALLVMTQSILTSKRQNDFKLVCETKSLARDIPVYKYKSLKTGLHVVIAKVDGPIVQGFFTIATEAQDDDGLPHTLEHLIFLGSEDYPYKGVLDLLANRCLAEGTNAWTDTDHTAYTVATAGSDGFLNLLPIYLNHLLFPTLTDTAFTTEVYHITGQGEDGGVVYSEMQAIENTGPHLTLEALVRILYPQPSGYHYETGGKMANLRESITNNKIRNFHQALYQPENLHVIITGQVDPEEVFKVLKPLEDKIIAKGHREEFSKPWKTVPPPFDESRNIEVVYPSDTEDTGIVHVGWRGPSVLNDITEYQSMVVLMKYLTDSSVSPLPEAFIEVEDPLASEVKDDMLRNSVSSCILTFSGVPKDKISDVKQLLQETLRKLVNGTTPFDLEMMKDMLNNHILKEERNLETSPHPIMADIIINDMLFGENCEYFDKVMNKITWYKHLLTETTTYWINLLEKYLISSPSVVIRGLPSIARAKELQEQEEKRIANRTVELGEEGLKKLGEKVEEAKRLNEIPPSESLLESVPLPSAKNINFHSIRAYTNIKNHHCGNITSSAPNLSLDLNSVPIKMQLDDVKSNFVQIVVVLDTNSLSYDERLYLPLLQELLLESSIVKDGGGKISYVDVIKSMNADTLKMETMSGLTLRSSTFSFGQYFHVVGFHLQVEMAKYEKGVQWVSDILFRVVFDPERVSVKATKLLNSIGDKKREGNVILNLMHSDVLFKSATNINAVNPLRQEKFLNRVIQKMKNDSTEILQYLEKVYRKITRLDSITIHMAANLEKLTSVTNILKPWSDAFPFGSEPLSMEMNVISDWEEYSPPVESDNCTGYVATVGSIESGYIIQSTPAIANFSHPDLPILLTVISYLTQLEGPMWKQIRGKGLAYGYYITIKPNEGLLHLKLGKAAQLALAYTEAVEIINAHLNDSKAWNRLLFESARSSLVFEIIDREAEIPDIVQQSLYVYHWEVPHNYNQELLQALERIKLEDLHRIANKYLRPLIDPKSSRTVVVCPPSRAEEIQVHLHKMGHNLQVIESLEDSRFAKLHQ